MKVGDSFILRAVAALLFFVINVFAIYLLLRGHNLPGGGFIGGLGSALSFLLLSLAFGVQTAERALRGDPARIAIIGLLVALGSSLLPVVIGKPFLQQFNFKLENLPILGSLSVGTPLIFDLGVFLVVVGVATKLIFLLARTTSGLPAVSEAERALYAAPMEESVEDTRPMPRGKGREL